MRPPAECAIGAFAGPAPLSALPALISQSMFDRFVRLAQARRALRDRHFEAALGLLDDPLIRGHQKAAKLRDRALQGLFARARTRFEAGSLSAARQDLDAVLAQDREFEGAASLRRELTDGAQRRDVGRTAGLERCRAARRHAEQGALAEALGLLEDLEGVDAEVVAVRDLIAGRRSAATAALQQARAALGQGELSAAQAALASARALDQAVDGLHAIEAEVAVGLTGAFARDLDRMLADGRASDALLEIARRRREQPRVLEAQAVQKRIKKAADAVGDRVRQHLERGDLPLATAELGGQDEAERALIIRSLGAAPGQLESIDASCRRGDWKAAAEELHQLCERAQLGKAARDIAKRFEGQAESFEAGLHRARDLATEGDLVGARAALVEILELSPMHEGARRELEMVEAGVRDNRARFDQAREAASAGRLREATSLLLTLAVPGSAGDEARLVLRDVRARVDAVQRGIDQVQRDAHGRASGSVQGLEQCVARVRELRALQTDAEDLDVLEAAMTAEIEGLRALATASEAISRSDVGAYRDGLLRYQAVASKFLGTDRLAARLADLLDEGIRRAELALDAGRLSASRAILDASASHAVDAGQLDRIETLRGRVTGREAVAEGHVTDGMRALASRELEQAEDALDAARLAWVDGGAVRRLESELTRVRDERARLEGVEAMVEADDVGAAQDRLTAMGPTHGLLRTRIYDLKKNLAKAQGLDLGFLLRVDEGGEFLVLRGETISIGNVRDGTADIPVLANIAGRHARIRRSLSFHGGMQDSIEADQGEVFVDGEASQKSRLRDGQSVRLGPSLKLNYNVPCRRSLSAVLTLRGYTVGGTDKLLLLKDRGRDGRIVIGPGRDVHIQVSSATAEVEVFAGKDGQVRVRPGQGGGEIDGRPFHGEEPLTAGAVVTCCGVTFVAQPWTGQ